MENKPCHFLEKLLITNAIYQLNKYNKAWLNKNLAKTPTSFRNCLKYSENRNIQSDFPYNCKFIANFGFIYTPSFLYETGFLPGLKFPTSHIICVVSVRLFSFWIDWQRTKEPWFRRPFLKSRQMLWYTDIHTYIYLYSGSGECFRRALNSFNWRAFTYSWLRAQATQAGHVQKSRINIFEVPTIPLLSR